MQIRVLLVGGNGFYGTNFINLLDKKYEIGILMKSESNILHNFKKKTFKHKFDFRSINNCFKKFKPNIVLLFATKYLNHHRNIDDLDLIVKNNINFGVYVLEAIKKNNIKYLINFNSYQQYKNNLFYPKNFYSASKEAFNNILKYYNNVNKIFYANVIIHDTYGDFDNRNKIFNYIKNLAIKKKKILKISNLDTKIAYTHINDIVFELDKLISKLVSKNKNYDKYYLPVSEIITIKKLISFFENAFECNFKIYLKNSNINTNNTSFDNIKINKNFIKIKDYLTNLK